MRSPQVTAAGRLGLGACLTVIGLAGCGETGVDGFHEYGSLERTAVDAPVESAPCNSTETLPSPADLPPMLAFTDSPVTAPVPMSADGVDGGEPDDASAIAAAEAPTPATNGGDESAAADGSVSTSAAAPREVKILVSDRTFRVEGPEQAIRVTFDDIDLLKVINMEPVTADAPEQMPQWLGELNGRRIRIRGYMYPAFKDTGLTAFQIARDTEKCCFGTFAKLYDRFVVRMRKDVTTDFILRRPFDVIGVLHIDPQVFEGELYQMYRIDDAIVIEK